MATAERDIDATPDQVFDLLADAPAYGRFVVGAKEVRSFDPSWPATGSQLHHTSGLGPLEVKDRTEVRGASERPGTLALRAGLRPLGQADVTFTIRPTAQGCHVTVEEGFVSGVLRLLPACLTTGALVARNAEMLRRLDEEVVRRSTAGPA